ncbi:hypothetical protein C1H46_003321 [Malus baccata]|uniref:Uncharacterized protein n=1 Tax=Malus baccata TaxID=106549 RepID=A0A540NJ53_MALBA|nr:hypothetical protein C1H46_003321 [Malus baccata]
MINNKMEEYSSSTTSKEKILDVYNKKPCRKFFEETVRALLKCLGVEASSPADTSRGIVCAENPPLSTGSGGQIN